MSMYGKKEGIIDSIVDWCAKKELPQDDVLNLVYRVLVWSDMSPTPDGVPDLKKYIAKEYANILGYEYKENKNVE